MTSETKPISVQTCEDDAAGRRPRVIVPRDGQTPTLFDFDDIFGVRRGVHPLFKVGPSGDLQGYGSCFAADPWGTLLTADHVIDTMRGGLPEDQGFVALLGIGIVFGDVRVPPEGIAPILHAFTPAIPGDNPINLMRGDDRPRPLDIAVLKTRDSQPATMAGTLPVKLGQGPRVGDIVVALGFPYVDTIHASPEGARTIISEGGLQAAYGTVTALHPRGRDRANPTPVFEVAAHWPSGMSGGPVLNASGEVIGLVSRAMDPEPGQDLGTGWAVWFEALPTLAEWAPTLDPCNPKWRRCYAVSKVDSGAIVSTFPTRALAERFAAEGPGYEVVAGSWRVGTTDFIGSGPNE